VSILEELTVENVSVLRKGEYHNNTASVQLSQTNAVYSQTKSDHKDITNKDLSSFRYPLQIFLTICLTEKETFFAAFS